MPIVALPKDREVVMTDTWLTTAETSGFMKIPVGTLYDWRASGRPCPPAIRVGRHLRWRRSDVEQWMASRAEGSK
jgi:excisionase family DNA binding protein